MNTQKTIIEQALKNLGLATGFRVELLEYKPYEKAADALIAIAIEDRRYEYAVEVKNVDRFETLGQVKHQLERCIRPPLLITRRLTAETAKKCREIKLNFIDLQGNAYINEPDFLLFIKGQKDKLNQENALVAHNPKRIGTAANLRMIFTLLCNPENLNAPYREIAKNAGIALGAVGWVFYDLENRGFTVLNKNENRRVMVERNKLINEWVMTYPIKLRPKLRTLKFKARDNQWWENIDPTKYNAQWGGEVGAAKLTNYLKPERVVIYFQQQDQDDNIKKIVMDNRLVLDPKGDIELIGAFWNFGESTDLPETVPPLLIYADLVATNDPRNLELAKKILEDYL